MTIEDIIPDIAEPSEAFIKHAEADKENYNPAIAWQMGFLACQQQAMENVKKYKEV
jgi:hypothetical protein